MGRTFDHPSTDRRPAGHPSTFGIRNFKLEHGRVTDSGWSCWKDGDRVQTRTLDVLFAEAPGHPFFERTT